MNQGSAIVNPLVCETPEEQKTFQSGDINKLHRKMLQEECLFRVPPNESGLNVTGYVEFKIKLRYVVTIQLKFHGSELLKFLHISFFTEKTLVHELFMSVASPEELSFISKHNPQNSVWLEDTKLKNLIICHPEVSSDLSFIKTVTVTNFIVGIIT